LKKAFLLIFSSAFLTSCSHSPVPSPKTSESSEVKQPSAGKSFLPYRMGGDFAGGGGSDDEQTLNKKVSLADAVREALKNRTQDVRLSDPFGFSPKLKRSDLELFYGADTAFIKSLAVPSNDLKDDDLEPIQNLKLETLDAHENELHDLHALKNMQTLKCLDVSSCGINSDGILLISNLTNLDTLNLDGCDFIAGDWKKLTALKKLKSLQLHGCRGIGPTDLEALKKELPACAVAASDSAGIAGGERAMKLDIQRIKSEIMGSGDFAEADLALAASIDRWKGRTPAPYQGLARAYRMRGDCMDKLANWEKAQLMYSQSLALYQKHLPDSEDRADAALRCADCCSKLNQYEREKAMRQEADKYWRGHAPGLKMEGKCRRNRQWLKLHRL